ncbi:histidine kinase dimerization/phosphoacceptor domain -containing protein [Mariniflexile gromovii]|uniref:histidine kinase n=1 Tax=Mariniflexile gromovii TaxID=362523 RepID=A0ABS4BUP9_9FLAO|nr:histidine kinase dimerization/phosphoacceptor domain -containing protein [Mariniflexile gromovii]MBP0904313.1 ATP-binding protein [Mariniflexile gromovii]
MLALIMTYCLLSFVSPLYGNLPYQNDPNIQKVKVYLEKGKKFLHRPESFKADMDSATYYFEKAIQNSKHINDSVLKIDIKSNLAELNFEKSNFDIGISYFSEVTDFYHRNNLLKEEADTWYRMGIRVFYDLIDYEKALEAFNKALEIYTKLNLKKEQIDVITFLGDVYLNEGHLDLARDTFVSAMDSGKLISYRQLHYIYFLLAQTLKLRGDLDKGLFYAFESVNHARKVKDTSYINYYYMTVAEYYNELGNHGQSSIWYRNAMDSSKKSNNIDYLFFHTSNYCNQLILQKKTREVMSVLNDLKNKFPPNTAFTNGIYNKTLGDYYKALNKIDLSLTHYNLALTFFDEIKNTTYPRIIAELDFDVGELLLNRKSYDSAKYYLNKFLKFPVGINKATKHRDCQLLLFKIDSSMGNYVEAIKHYQAYKSLEDSIFNEKKSKQIEELQISYETKKKEENIASLQNITNLQKSRLETLNTTKNFVLGILILLTVIIVLLIHRYFLKQKTNRILVSQKGEIDQKNITLQNLVKEKEWLLKEIHHRVKNNLQILMSLLNIQSNYLENKDALNAIKTSQHKLHAIALIHQKLYTEDDISLITMKSYINDLVKYFGDSFEVKHIEFKMQVDDVTLDVNKSVPVGLILNEALTNAIKYAYPNKSEGIIYIYMKKIENSEILLEVIDEGVGFPDNFDPYKTNSLGISLIKGLTQQLKGIFSIISEKGVKLSIRFPYDLDKLKINQV